jgi:RNA polymerase subunit RPABC4/transcription elongation factor Spt4
MARKGVGKSVVLRILAIMLVLAGLTSLMSIFGLFLLGVVSSTIGFLLGLVLVFVSAFLIGTARPVWGAQIGERLGILRTIAMDLPFRLILIYLFYGPFIEPYTGSFEDQLAVSLFIGNVSSLVFELIVFVYVYYKKEYFMPAREDVESSMKRLKVTGVRTVSDCPNCKSLVEADWHSCPSCGTLLPKFCVNCGTPVDENIKQCPKCGTSIRASVAIANLIETLHQTAELPASPETKSVRYEKYAEALIKGGRTDEAIEAYRTAIHYTQFYRKQTNFMVKMATVYHNTGRDKQALDLCDASLELDPQDWAGAKQLKDQILAVPAPPPSSGTAPVKA